MPERRDDRLVIAVTAQALFDLAETTARAGEPLRPGPALPLIKALQGLNRAAADGSVEIVLVSRTQADAGPALLSAARRHGLDITRAAFTGGREPYPHLRILACKLFLTTDEADLWGARRAGLVAGLVRRAVGEVVDGDEIRIVFDGDAAPFAKHFSMEAAYPSAGSEPGEESLSHLLRSLGTVQQLFPRTDCPLRTALLVARPSPADELATAALTSRNLRVDESMLLRGDETDLVLEVLRPHLFFTDQLGEAGPAVATVPVGPIPAQE